VLGTQYGTKLIVVFAPLVHSSYPFLLVGPKYDVKWTFNCYLSADCHLGGWTFGRWSWQQTYYQGILKGEVSLYSESAVWPLKFFVFICKPDQSKPVKQEVNGTVILPPPLVFPVITCSDFRGQAGFRRRRGAGRPSWRRPRSCESRNSTKKVSRVDDGT